MLLTLQRVLPLLVFLLPVPLPRISASPRLRRVSLLWLAVHSVVGQRLLASGGPPASRESNLPHTAR